jgi:hypothetical protein
VTGIWFGESQFSFVGYVRSSWVGQQHQPAGVMTGNEKYGSKMAQLLFGVIAQGRQSVRTFSRVESFWK